MREGFRIADAGQHRSRGRHARIERRARFLDQAALDLTPAALCEPVVDHVEACCKADTNRLPVGRRPRAQRAQRRSRGLEDLNRADHAHRIVEVDPGVWIQGEEPFAQGFDGVRLKLRAQLGVGRDACEAEAVAERVDVKHRPALNDRLSPSR